MAIRILLIAADPELLNYARITVASLANTGNIAVPSHADCLHTRGLKFGAMLSTVTKRRG